ncbi:bacillithiol biosynthesis deacetylase BshB2 [Paenibacillus endophyticus]|uniref:Bacillithiol biosynthesis deacetylase BshB2 n=1 Tax=Paenibacillus endophyticus TaxID=1294268 RepID=A0A7W5CDL9_9BACL|nr:PIG-L family deacetylase [Paenibacillus endophyticus]MBB3154909.1 bacillithiol biosynthesis deacetylase BshB2 [Paenibacillus endophyticus]
MSRTTEGAKRTILAVFAHPDDESFICGGTLAKYASLGAEITLVSATRGEMGRRMGNPPYVNRETMPDIREKELRKACEELGIQELIFFDIRDKMVEFYDSERLIERIGELMEAKQPDVVLTFHETLGGHPDHCAIGKATSEAFRRAQQKGSLFYITFGDAMEAPELFGYTKQDVVRIDVRGHLKAKLAAFRAHRCQTEIDEWVWLPDREALAKLGGHEYFLAGNRSVEPLVFNDLFQARLDR